MSRCYVSARIEPHPDVGGVVVPDVCPVFPGLWCAALEKGSQCADCEGYLWDVADPDRVLVCCASAGLLLDAEDAF